MPSGPAPISLLFTDIEGSTRLWETETQKMAAALARHDALCRDLIAARRGRIVKHTGDGLCAAFPNAADALSAAIALQQVAQRLAREHDLPLKLRCGVHHGDVETRDGDCFGPTVNCAARVMDAAYGGQVLLTQAFVDTVGDRRHDGAETLHLGRVRLRGLSSPLDVWQVVHPDLRRTFPPLRTLDSIPHNLPRPVTSLIGRDTEIAELTRLVGTTSLLTLTGAGGCGKSRLALEVATKVVEGFPDGAWLVELASLADGSLVPHAVASVLGGGGDAGVPTAESLVRHLESRTLLLVLDNAEHLLDACAQLVDVVLRRCRGVRLLVTSREGLNVAGEITYRVPSLTTPEIGSEATPDRLLEFHAVALFAARAQAHDPRFTVTAQNAAAVASVCRRLDGIPLAIELAAARLRAMTVEEIDRRLDQRFRLLTGGSRTALPRQQTLRSLIDWSYDLLSPLEQRVLNRCSVFADGWDLAAAERVAAGDGVDADAVLDVLGSLVDKSLVVATERHGATRYRQLETMRQYARDRLFEAGESRAVRDRHLDFFCALVDEVAPLLRGPDAQTALDRLQPEVDNLRTALDWSLAEGSDAAGGLRLASRLVWFWFVRGYYEEGRDIIIRLLAATPDVLPTRRASAMSGAGILASQCGDTDRARALHRDALAIFRDADVQLGLAQTLNNLGIIAEDQGDYAEARTMYEQCVAIAREQGDRASLAASLSNLGNVWREAGDLVTAKAIYEEALAMQRELGDVQRIGNSLVNMSIVALRLGDFAAATALAAESLATGTPLGDRRAIVFALEQFASLAVAVHAYERAARLLGHAERLREDTGLARAPAERQLRAGELAALRAAMPEPALEEAWRAGRALDTGEMIRFALETAPVNG